jgi:hypothetical protein
MESTVRQKASARPSSSVTVGRRCAGANDGLVIGGARWSMGRKRASAPYQRERGRARGVFFDKIITSVGYL